MFWFLIDVLALRRLGLSKPFRYLLLTLLLGCVIAGMIYTAVVFQALNERSHVPHVHPNSAH
jgi:hypothetical protein